MSVREQRKSYEAEDFFADVTKSDSLIKSYRVSSSLLKSGNKATAFRSSGNQLFTDKKYKDAILLYNLVRNAKSYKFQLMQNNIQ